MIPQYEELLASAASHKQSPLTRIDAWVDKHHYEDYVVCTVTASTDQYSTTCILSGKLLNIEDLVQQAKINAINELLIILNAKQQGKAAKPANGRPIAAPPTPKAEINKDDANELKILRTLMGMGGREGVNQLNPFINEWSKGRLTSWMDINQENIKAFNKFLKDKAITLLGKDKVEEALKQTSAE